MTIPKSWFARVRAGGVNFYSCYASPSASDSEFEEFFDNLTEDVRKRELVVIAGDFNVATN